jgi:hypothetical protein
MSNGSQDMMLLAHNLYVLYFIIALESKIKLCCKKIRIFIKSEFVFPFPSQCLSWWQAGQIRHFAEAKPSMDQIRERVLTVCRAYDKVTADKVFISSIFVTIFLCVFFIPEDDFSETIIQCQGASHS